MTMLRGVDNSTDLHARLESDAGIVRGSFAVGTRDLGEGITLVSVAGELDLSTSPRFKWTLLDAIKTGKERLVVDLSRVDFMDSMALGVLITVKRRLDVSDGRLAIVCARERVLQIFELSGIDGVFAIRATLEQALAHVRGAGLPDERPRGALGDW